MQGQVSFVPEMLKVLQKIMPEVFDVMKYDLYAFILASK